MSKIAGIGFAAVLIASLALVNLAPRAADARGGCTGAACDLGEEACGVGECEMTVDLCVDGQCVPGDPIDEVCDGLDNDCDEYVDEDLPVTPTMCGAGECAAAGYAMCVGGDIVDDCMPGTPSAEICDALDNDCDGDVDEDQPITPTTCGVGECAAMGDLMCTNGAFVDDCTPDPPFPEICDGLDNDCDGAIDEGLDCG